jgi:protein TonB
MAFQSLGPTEPRENSTRISTSQPLSQSGQLIGWGVYGTLLVIGFGFGIVTGYERPKTIAQAKASPDKDQPSSDIPKPDTKTTPKSTPSSDTPQTPPTGSPKDTTSTTPAVTPKTKVDTKPPMPFKTDPKPPLPTTTTPPKVDPKPPMPTTTTPPKTDSPKKEDLKAVSFKTDVLPILRRHCLDCHGGGKGKPKGNVDLTTIAKIMASPSPGKALVPGKPEQSDIYTSITEREMPDGGKPKPSKEDLLILKNWILTGAKERRRIIRGRKRMSEGWNRQSIKSPLRNL